jgi:hypothetical protein
MTKQKRTRRRFTAEFKTETVKLVKQSNRTMADVAMELRISAKSLTYAPDWSPSDSHRRSELSCSLPLMHELRTAFIDRDEYGSSLAPGIRLSGLHPCGTGWIPDRAKSPLNSSALPRHYSDRYAETQLDLLTRDRFCDTQRTLKTGQACRRRCCHAHAAISRRKNGLVGGLTSCSPARHLGEDTTHERLDRLRGRSTLLRRRRRGRIGSR